MVAETGRPYTTRQPRLPSIDGMRGVAILLVLIAHLDMNAGVGIDRIEWIERLGDLGVKIFFVLSGFLITSLLVTEQRRTGRIAIVRFIIRRSLRIFPPAYLYIFSITLAAAAGWLESRPADALAALTYTMNFNVAPGWWLGHTWSLSVEEQFYLVWPLALVLARPRSPAYMAGAILIAAPIARGVIITSFPDLSEGIDRAFMTAVDGFAAGGLLAILRDRLERRERYLQWLGAWWVPGLWLLAGSVNQLEHHPLSFFVLLQPIVYLLLAVGLHRALVVPNDWPGRLLNWQPLIWLGSVSYSLYLWQQPFLAPEGSNPVQAFPLNLVIAIALAWASSRFVERPCLRLRDRWWPAQVVTMERRSGGAAPARPEVPA